jgi:hypothetical protein
VAVNDHPDEARDVALDLPVGWDGLPARCRRVSEGVLDEPFAPAVAAGTGSIRTAVPAMTLLVWSDEVAGGG